MLYNLNATQVTRNAGPNARSDAGLLKADCKVGNSHKTKQDRSESYEETCRQVCRAKQNEGKTNRKNLNRGESGIGGELSHPSAGIEYVCAQKGS